MNEKCCICGKPIEGNGNDPYPLREEGRCCDACNVLVIKKRFELSKEHDSKRPTPPEQLAWFRENFDHTKNQELADHLGTSIRTVTRMARELGLWKTKEFVAAMQRNASEHGARATRLMGGNAGAVNLLKYGKATRFKPGTSQKERMSAEALADMHRRIGESRKETFRKERIRVNWGFEQKTNLRVIRCPPEKVHVRNKLRKRGYEIPRASNEATVTNETRRSIRMEARAEKMGIKFHFNTIAI